MLSVHDVVKETTVYHVCNGAAVWHFLNQKLQGEHIDQFKLAIFSLVPPHYNNTYSSAYPKWCLLLQLVLLIVMQLFRCPLLKRINDVSVAELSTDIQPVSWFCRPVDATQPTMMHLLLSDITVISILRERGSNSEIEKSKVNGGQNMQHSL